MAVRPGSRSADEPNSCQRPFNMATGTAQALSQVLGRVASPRLADLNAPTAWAALTTFVWYAVGMVPVQIAAAQHFGLDKAHVSSWIFIIWFSGAIASIALSCAYRQPLAVTSSLPAMVFLTTVANQFSFAELLGANLLAGLLTVGLGISGFGRRLLVWLPMPLVMGMLAGSILSQVLHVVSTSTEDVIVGGATLAGYLLGCTWRLRNVPPVGLAVVSGGLAVLVAQRFTPATVDWGLPTLVVPDIQLSLPAFAAVSLPLVLLSVGLGNAQALGYLVEQGYRVPINRVTVVLGLNTILNALFGGHTAQASRNGIPILGGPEAGPHSGRYWGSLLVGVAMLLIAMAAEPVVSLLGFLPMGYLAVLAGLALVPSFQNAVEKAFGGTLRLGGLVAFLVAATPFSALGITSAFWALPASVGVSWLAERAALLAYWRSQHASGVDRRRERRMPVMLHPAADRITGGSRTAVDVDIRELSASGVRLHSDQRLLPGEQLELMFGLPGGGGEVRLRVDVRHVGPAPTGVPLSWEAGCEFRDLDKSSAQQVAEFILRQQEIPFGRHQPRPAPTLRWTAPDGLKIAA